MESVERMLAAVERLVRRARSADSLTLEAVAREAHVTPQAAYRYFRDVDDVIGLFVRRLQTVEHELLMATLIDQRFETERDLAMAVVSFVVDAFRQVVAVPGRIRERFARDHSGVCYGLVWTIAEIVCATMASRGDPCAGIGVIPLNCALVCVISVAVSFGLRDDRLIVSGTSQAVMLDLFIAAIESGPRPPS